MITLDYQTNNPRWGWSGMEFVDWNSFALTLGFLSNIRHYQGYGHSHSIWDDSISIHFEQNDRQGAWGREGRIHYYKALPDLQHIFLDLHTHSSAGVGSIACRINSNNYIEALIYDFGFIPTRTAGRLTVDVYPPNNARASVGATLQSALASSGLARAEIASCMNSFDDGWNV